MFLDKLIVAESVGQLKEVRTDYLRSQTWKRVEGSSFKYEFTNGKERHVLVTLHKVRTTKINTALFSEVIYL